MSVIEQLELLKCLVKTYFDENLQRDESPKAAKNREEIKKQIIILCEK
jgi:hypothetical protein